MVECMMKNEFGPLSAEHILTSFKTLDLEGKGYIRKDVLQQLLTTQGIPLRPRDNENFMSFAVDQTGQFVFYEDYVNKLIHEYESHKEFLLKDYDSFDPSLHSLQNQHFRFHYYRVFFCQTYI